MKPIVMSKPTVVCEAAAYVTGNLLGGKLSLTDMTLAQFKTALKNAYDSFL